MEEKLLRNVDYSMLINTLLTIHIVSLSSSKLLLQVDRFTISQWPTYDSFFPLDQKRSAKSSFYTLEEIAIVLK